MEPIIRTIPWPSATRGRKDWWVVEDHGDGYSPLYGPYALRSAAEDRASEVRGERTSLANAAPDLLAALQSVLPYLEHPDVQAMPFALPAGPVAARVRALVDKLTKEGV